MWQVPAFAIALQALLVRFAVDGGAVWSLHFVAAVALTGVSIASLQTMRKHRYYHQVDAAQLGILEQRMGVRTMGIVVHGPPDERLGLARGMGVKAGQFTQISSHGAWLWVLRLIVIFDVGVIVAKLA